MSVALIITNLRAEGGTTIALDLAAQWRAHRPVVLCLNDHALDMAPRFAALGVAVETLGIADVSYRSAGAIARRVANALTRHAATAIVSVPTGVHGAIFAGARLAGVKRRVAHMGNYPWHWQPDFWKYRLQMQLSAPLTPDLVCVTRHVADGLRRHVGHVARRLHVIANGIDLDRFPFRGAPVPVSGRPIEIVMIGRLDSGKDHATLLDAVAILRSRGIPVRLTLVGDGALRGEIERRARPLAGAVRLLGARLDVPDLLAAADVFAFIVRPEEGFGIALAEAMAVGVPIVASDVGACREVLDQGRCGALSPAGNAEVLADALLDAAHRPDRNAARAARRRAETAYSRAAMAEAYGALCGLS